MTLTVNETDTDDFALIVDRPGGLQTPAAAGREAVIEVDQASLLLESLSGYP
jgi:hypothetical protein